MSIKARRAQLPSFLDVKRFDFSQKIPETPFFNLEL
jgi:hypothetical protein